MFLNIQICLITLKTYDQQFTLTTKKSLHIIFKHTTLTVHVTLQHVCDWHGGWSKACASMGNQTHL